MPERGAAGRCRRGRPNAVIRGHSSTGSARRQKWAAEMRGRNARQKWRSRAVDAAAAPDTRAGRAVRAARGAREPAQESVSPRPARHGLTRREKFEVELPGKAPGRRAVVLEAVAAIDTEREGERAQRSEGEEHDHEKDHPCTTFPGALGTLVTLRYS